MGRGAGAVYDGVMRVQHLHPWDVTPAEAMRLQLELAPRVVRRGDVPERAVRLVAGADCAFDRQLNRGVAAVTVLAYPALDAVTTVSAESPVTFPYVPGLLSFRETPLLLAAFERLDVTPDLVMIDGHGVAHPRRFGYASHAGLLLDVPTIGVAKSRLVGQHGPVGDYAGARADLVHDGEVIGSVLRTRPRMRPLYVSIGHRISLAAAERWVLNCARRYRIPEPTRLADAAAAAAKRRMLDATFEAVIEQRAGERGRWEWEPDSGEVVFRHDMPPMPLHYGCATSIINPADNEMLDVMVVDPRAYERGQRLHVRVVDVLRRKDGDDKLLAIPVDAAWPPERRLREARDRAWEWFVRMEKPVTHWGGEEDAIGVVVECRRAME